MPFSGQGYHNTQETYQRFNNRLTTIEETIAAIQAPPGLATPLSNHVNNQLGGRASPVYLDKYLFSLIIFTILSSLYISKKTCITKKQNKNLSL